MNNDPILHDEDIKNFGGYVYTISDKFSTVHATKRLSEAIISAFDYEGKSVIDIGCGDGKYTFELWEKGKPKWIVGIDLATEAVKLAQSKYGKQGIRFYDYSVYDIDFPDNYFDIAVVRAVIHHLDNPLKAMKEIVRVSKKIVLTDPNGYNLGVKIIEKLSPYHKRHKEHSYFPYQHNRWLKEAGAELIKDYYILLVPFFFPEFLAKILAILEIPIERSRFLSRIVCATHIRIAEKLPKDFKTQEGFKRND